MPVTQPQSLPKPMKQIGSSGLDLSWMMGVNLLLAPLSSTLAWGHTVLSRDFGTHSRTCGRPRSTTGQCLKSRTVLLDLGQVGGALSCRRHRHKLCKCYQSIDCPLCVYYRSWAMFTQWGFSVCKIRHGLWRESCCRSSYAGTLLFFYNADLKSLSEETALYEPGAVSNPRQWKAIFIYGNFVQILAWDSYEKCAVWTLVIFLCIQMIGRMALGRISQGWIW